MQHAGLSNYQASWSSERASERPPLSSTASARFFTARTLATCWPSCKSTDHLSPSSNQSSEREPTRGAAEQEEPGTLEAEQSFAGESGSPAEEETGSREENGDEDKVEQQKLTNFEADEAEEEQQQSEPERGSSTTAATTSTTKAPITKTSKSRWMNQDPDESSTAPSSTRRRKFRRPSEFGAKETKTSSGKASKTASVVGE